MVSPRGLLFESTPNTVLIADKVRRRSSTLAKTRAREHYLLPAPGDGMAAGPELFERNQARPLLRQNSTPRSVRNLGRPLRSGGAS